MHYFLKKYNLINNREANYIVHPLLLVRYILLYSYSRSFYIGMRMKVLAENINLINLRDELLEKKQQRKLEQQTGILYFNILEKKCFLIIY